VALHQRCWWQRRRQIGDLLNLFESWQPIGDTYVTLKHKVVTQLRSRLTELPTARRVPRRSPRRIEIRGRPAAMASLGDLVTTGTRPHEPWQTAGDWQVPRTAASQEWTLPVR
jgi:hypothetical protein